MYSHCLFCSASLGANEVVEHFPVGRRLAFDAARGRLWVVCKRCQRWNLTPLEERWEAIEECERLFRDTRLRMSTDNVGLARLPEGLELVRIGKPQRPEFAAWRYGDQFGRRRRNMILGAGAAVTAGGVLLATGAYAALSAAVPGAGLLFQLPNFYNLYRQTRKVHLRVPDAEGNLLTVRGKHLASAELYRDADAPWRLRITADEGVASLTGEPALRVTGRLLTMFNHGGGFEKDVRAAVKRLETAGGPEGLLTQIAKQGLSRPPLKPVWFDQGDTGRPGALRRLPLADRLALEMAANEEQERLALEGELASLEAAWKEAEEIAAIADDLLLPQSVGKWLEGVKKRE